MVSVYADTANGAVRRLRNGMVETLLTGSGDLSAGLIAPTGLLLHDGTLYICDPFAGKLFLLPLSQ